PISVHPNVRGDALAAQGESCWPKTHQFVKNRGTGRATDPAPPAFAPSGPSGSWRNPLRYRVILRVPRGNGRRIPGGRTLFRRGGREARRLSKGAGPFRDGAREGYSSRTFFSRNRARRRNSPTADALIPSACAISGYRKPS